MKAKVNEIELLRERIRDSKWYMEHMLRIRTKDQRLIPLTLNRPQQKLHAVMERQAAQGKPIRVIVLKARQQGMSTYIQGRGFHASSTNKYTYGLVIAHDTDGSDNLFAMSKRFFDHLPEEVELSDGSVVQIKPKPKYSNRKELHFADLDSRITIDTANNKDAGRSGTIQWFHGSEVAFWDDAKETMTAVMQAVPRTPGTMVVLESTANGVGGYFYEQWQRAKRGESDFEPVFIAWWELDEYRAPVLKPLDYDEEELRLKETYGLDDDQLQWRRDTIRTECQGDVDKFRQEYPANDQEAFLTSGRLFFNRNSLLLYEKQTVEPKRKGFLRETEEGVIGFVDDPDGPLWVWEEPKPGNVYAVGGDVAEGLESGDFSAAQVINRRTFEQAAEWHGHTDADLFGDDCYRLARWYNDAVLGIEVNNHGLTTNKRVEARGYRRLYYRKVIDTKSERQTDRVGWHTNSQTRPIMLDELAEGIRELYLLLNSGRLITECLSFVVNPKGKPEAQEGCFDDLVMAMAIAIQVHSLMPIPTHYENEQPPRRKVISKAAGY